MASDPKIKLRKLLTNVLTPQATYASRADAAEGAAVRLAKRMLATGSTYTMVGTTIGFACDEPRYGDGSGSYLTNAQGLVGVLLPLVEVEWAQLDDSGDDSEVQKVLQAATYVVNQANRKTPTDVWFSLEPYVGDGSIRKAFRDQVKDFYSTTGASWALSSLVLLYLCHLLGKIDIKGDDFAVEDVVNGIEATYVLLLRSYKQSDGRAGWSWCSLADVPDLYHTWSVSQTLGDMEDYVFAPPQDATYAVDPGLDKLRRRLLEATPASFRHGEVKSPTESIYRDACRWLYSELTASASPAIKEEMSDLNVSENEIYYTFFLVETLVYMHADELLPSVMNVSRETVRNTLYEKLLVGANRLGSLRDTDWYGSEERSTLAVPLPVKTGKLKDQQLLEPSLEPLVLRALSYGPLYLSKRDIFDFVVTAVTRHANVLDEKVELWDERGPNFLICERTVEALLMVRNMFRNTSEIQIAPPPVPEPSERTAGITLTLSAEQVTGLVEVVTNRVLDRVRQQIEELVTAERASLASESTDGNVGDIQSVVDPEGYKDIARPEKILLYLDEPAGLSEATVYQTMLLETIVKLLTGVLRSSKPAAASGGDDESLSEKLADGLAHAIASTLPRAVAYYLADRIERMEDGDVLGESFDGRRIEQQVDRLALTYVEKEFKDTRPFDLAVGLSEALAKVDRLPGGSK